MLVLTRKPGETIRIGDDVCLTILKVAGRKVRVGVQAPKDTLVIRGELLTAKQLGELTPPALAALEHHSGQ